MGAKSVTMTCEMWQYTFVAPFPSLSAVTEAFRHGNKQYGSELEVNTPCLGHSYRLDEAVSLEMLVTLGI